MSSFRTTPSQEERQVALAWTGERGENEEFFGTAFARSVKALATAEIPYVLVGGLASSIRGRPRARADIDLLVKTSRSDLAEQL